MMRRNLAELVAMFAKAVADGDIAQEDADFVIRTLEGQIARVERLENDNARLDAEILFILHRDVGDLPKA